MNRYKLVLILLTVFSFSNSLVLADDVPQKSYEERKAEYKKACDACTKGVKKDPGEWDISAALGFNITQGNAHTTLLTGQTVAHREIEQDIYHLDLNGAYGKQDGDKTQSYFKADAAYKRLLGKGLYATFSQGYLTDDIAEIDYRTTTNPGIGYFLLKDETISLGVETGPTYIFQKLSGVKDNFIAGRVANDFSYKISETAKITQTAEYILDLEDTNQSILNGSLGIEASLTSQLALVWTIRDRYNSQPAVGAQKNDLFITSALKVSF